MSLKAITSHKKSTHLNESTSTTMATTNTPNHHIVIIPSPGMGHLIPLVEFAKLLHSHHHFSITLLLPSSSPPTTAQTTLLSTLPSAISHTFLPPVDPTLLPLTASHGAIIHHIHSLSIPSLRTALLPLSNVVAVVTDLFGTDYFDIAREFMIPPYMYFTTNAFCLSFLFHLSYLDKTVPIPYQELEHPLVLPGCVPLLGKDFDDPTLDRQSEGYKLELYNSRRYNLAEGVFVNTFYDLEPGALRGLQSDSLVRTKIYPVGPIIRSGSDDVDNVTLECMSWLDQQPPNSVLFVSFGSGGTLSSQQIHELAIGLEKSGLRFLWVVKGPNDESSCGSFFGFQNQTDYYKFDFLPRGYMDRIKDRGLLIPSWAPQIKILAHKSTGGFLSHCGWNSILESVVYGVPLIAWPLYAEQRMNAVMLNEGLKVALRTNDNEGGLVGADEIANVVNELMKGEEGDKVRKRMKELSEAANKARSEDGDSTKVLSQVTQQWCQE